MSVEDGDQCRQASVALGPFTDPPDCHAEIPRKEVFVELAQVFPTLALAV